MATPIRTPKRDEAPHTKEAPNTAGTSSSTDFVILEEEIDPNYVPTDSEIEDYAKWLGMDITTDKELFWIAREGLKAPLPKDWKPCKTKDTEEIYYFNFTTGDSTWDHPCDGYYRSMYEENKKKLVKEKSSKGKHGKKESKKRSDLRQDSKGPSEISVASKLDLKPLSFGGIKPITKPSITQQPLPRMASLNEEDFEPMGPPPILEVKVTKNEEHKPKKTMKDVEDVISPRQLLRKSKKTSLAETNYETGGSTPMSATGSSTSSSNDSSPANSPNTISEGNQVKSKKKGLGSKKFARGLASALTSSNELADDPASNELDHETITTSAGGGATVLRQTRLMGNVIDGNSQDFQQRESELQEKHVKELRHLEDRFNVELSDQRSKLTQSLTESNEKLKAYKAKCEKHMDKLKKSVEATELEKKELFESNAQFSNKIETLEKELSSKNHGSDDFNKLRIEYELKVKELQSQHEFKVKKLELSLQEAQRSALNSAELVKHHEATLAEKEIALKQLHVPAPDISSQSEEKTEILMKNEALISDLEKQLLAEKRKNDALLMELSDSQRKCKFLESSLDDLTNRHEEQRQLMTKKEKPVDVESSADRDNSEINLDDEDDDPLEGTVRMETQLMNKTTQGSEKGEEFTTCESNASKLHDNTQSSSNSFENKSKPCVEFSLGFKDLNIDGFDQELRAHFLHDVATGMGIPTKPVPLQSGETQQNGSLSLKRDNGSLTLSILTVAAGSVIIEAQVIGFESIESSEQFAEKAGSVEPSAFLDVERYGECCYLQKPVSATSTATTSENTPSPASSCSFAQSEVTLPAPSRPAPSIPNLNQANSTPVRQSTESQSSALLESPVALLPLSPQENEEHPSSSPSSDEIKNLQLELATRTSALNRATQELNNVLLEVKELREKYSHVSSQRDEECLLRKRLERELEASKIEKEVTANSVALTAESKVQHSTSLNEKVSKLLIEKTKLEESCFEKDRRLLDGQVMIDSLSSKMAMLQQELDEKTSSFLRAESSVGELERKLSQALEAASIADKRATNLANDAALAASRSSQETANAIAAAVQACELRAATSLTQAETEVKKLSLQLSETRDAMEAALSKARAEEAEHSFFESKSKRLEQERSSLEEKLASIRSDLEVSSARIHAMQCASDDAASAKRSAEARAVELEKRVNSLIEVAAKGEAEASRLREQLHKEVNRLRARDAASTPPSTCPPDLIFPEKQQQQPTLAPSSSPATLSVEEETTLRHQLSNAHVRIKELESELESTRSQLLATKKSSEMAIQNASLLSAEVVRLESALKEEKDKISETISPPLTTSSITGMNSAGLSKVSSTSQASGGVPSPETKSSQPPPNKSSETTTEIKVEQRQAASSLERQLSEAALGLIADEGPPQATPPPPSQPVPKQKEKGTTFEDAISYSNKSITDIFCLAAHWKSSLDVARSEVLRRKKEVAASQRSLENRRATWRRARDKQHAQSTATSRGLIPGNGKFASLQQAKEASAAAKHVLREQRNVLDGETQVLNAHVNELRVASAWLSERGSKLDKLDSLLRTVKRMQKAYGSSNQHGNFEGGQDGLNESFNTDSPSLLKMDGLSLGYTGDDTIALTLAEINDLTLDLEDGRTPPRNHDYHHHMDAYDMMSVPQPPQHQHQSQYQSQHQHQSQYQYPPPPPPVPQYQDASQGYYSYNDIAHGIENYQPIPTNIQPPNMTSSYSPKYNMSTIGPVGFGSGQGRFNYSRPSSQNATTQMAAHFTQGNAQQSGPIMFNKPQAPVSQSYSGFRVAMPPSNSARTAPSPRRVSHRSIPQQQAMSQVSVSHYVKGQTASEKLFAVDQASQGRNALNSNYNSVDRWTKSKSGHHTTKDEKYSWLETLRKDVTSIAATSRSRHSSDPAQAASAKKGGLAGAWMVLNEHTFNEMDNHQKRSRVTDALVSPSRRR